MRQIWKFPLSYEPEQDIPMPAGAEVLTVQMQDGEPYIWAKVDPETPSEVRMFYTFGTGWSLRDDLGRYVGTFQVRWYVWHLFEAKKP